MRRVKRFRRAVALLAVCVVMAACGGTRLSHDAIVSAGSGVAVSGGPGAVSGHPVAEGPAVGQPSGPVGATASSGAVAGTRGAAAGPSTAASAAPGTVGGRSSVGGGGAPIVIGTVGSYSGIGGASIGHVPLALRAWAASVNAKGGINGRKVRVIVYDDGNDGAKALSQVRDLVERQKAVAVLANMTPTLYSYRSYIEKRKVPLIGGACNLDVWYESPMLFSQCSSYDSLIYGTAATGAKLGKSKKWGAFVCQEADLCHEAEEKWFSKGYAKKAGLDPVYSARVSVAQPDFTSECLQARNADVGLLTVVADPNTVSRVAASCRRQGYSPQFLQVGSTVQASFVQEEGFSDLLLQPFSMPFAGVSTPAAEEFRSAWAAYGGSGVAGSAASIAWAAAKVFEKAARAAGDDRTSAGILKGLYTIKNDRIGGFTVPLTFRPGKPGVDAGCWFVMRAVNGKWTAPQGDRVDCRP